jgi:hypothetical protein
VKTRPPLQESQLTRRQLRRLRELPADYNLVSADDGIPIVESPSGRTLRVQPDGRLAASSLVERVQSYLHVPQG